jgi:2-methylcitrate dehydratase PrpD
MTTLTEQLATTLCRRKLDDIPAAITHEAKRLLLDFLGVGLAGSRTDSGRIAAKFALDLGGPPQAGVFGTTARITAVHAAFANAIASHSVELDDVDEEALFHHGPPVVAAALAVAEMVRAGGGQLVSAIVAGCETMNRLSRATNPALRNRGFHTTPTCGAFGAAVAAGLLLELNEPELVSALGLAGAQASGLMEMYGTSMQKRFNPGPAARNGVTAALMARDGFTGADSIIEGERGFAAAFAGALDEDRFLEGLGVEVPVAVEYKAYSCARPIHSAIDAMLELRAQGLRAEEIADITVYRHPAWASYHAISRPRTFHEAQMSLPYSAALALIEGQALPSQYARVGVGDGATMALSAKVAIKADDRLARGVSVRAVVHTSNGDELVAEVDYPIGSRQRPLGDEQLAAKFTDLAAPSIGDGTVPLAAAVWSVERMADVDELAALVAPIGPDRHERS